MKRIFDFCFALILLFFTLPIIIVIFLVIIVTTGDSPLFRQQRLGKNKEKFIIHKFRTMVRSKGNSFIPITIGNDKRITPLGGFLRNYKLDELPQLFDILRGKMSFVGPRPELPEFLPYYPDLLSKVIFSVNPGITDPASIKYKNENDILSRKEDPIGFYKSTLLPEKLRISANYIKSSTILSDLKIIAQTIKSVYIKFLK